MRWSSRKYQRIAAVVGLLVTITLLLFAVVARTEPLWTALDERQRGEAVPITNETFAKLAEKLRPAVVNISTTMVIRQGPTLGNRPSPFGGKDPYRDFWEKFFGGQIPQEYETKSLGSGVIINKQGYILTNSHVVENAKGRVIGAGPYDDFIQTDASINPGNSGGPLFNFWGEVVGINTAIVATGQGIGFAIPINMAKEILPQLKEKGQVSRGWLGVGIQRITPQLAKSFGLKEEAGALVSQVFKDSPAERAGIKQGDIILEFDGKIIKEIGELSRTVASTPVGKTATLKVFREGKTLTLQAKIAEMKEEKEVAEAPSRKPLGLSVQDITPELARRLGIEEGTGVIVTRVEPKEPAAAAGINRGDVIQEVNRQPVGSVEEFNRALEQAKADEDILFLIRRGEQSLFILVPTK